MFLQLQISSKWKTIYDVLIWYILWSGYSVLQKAGQSPIYMSAHIQAHIDVTEGFNLSLSFSLIHFVLFSLLLPSPPLISSPFFSSPLPLHLLSSPHLSFLLPPLPYPFLVSSTLLPYPPSFLFLLLFVLFFVILSNRNFHTFIIIHSWKI